MTDEYLNVRTLWVSDVHLGTYPSQAKALLSFLARVRCEHLYLVGDIVDIWHLRRRWYWPATHNDVVQAFLARAHDGVNVTYIPGNHDEAVRMFDGVTFGGVRIVDRIVHTTADGKKLLVIHGDQFDAVVRDLPWLAHIGDAAYHLAMWISAPVHWIRKRMGLPYWSLSAYLKHKVKNAVAHVNAFETLLANAARDAGAEGVVCGHVHYAQIKTVGDRLYCNDGDWVESCTALVEHLDGRLEILRCRQGYA